MINITNRGSGDGWAKGSLVNPPADVSVPTKGWFPLSYVEEIASEHERAKLVKHRAGASDA